MGLKVINNIIKSNPKPKYESNGTVNYFNTSTGQGFNVGRNGQFNSFRDLKNNKTNN